ncbi:MAG: internal scaffolding protein [Microviridae sp.]|nr:MAG: internal scaffolding protein [Microviridae sp.]
MKFRKHFDYDVEKASDEACIPADQQGVSLTVQSMAEDADINVLMYRYGLTGKMPENPRVPVYADFTGISDYRSALDAVMSASAGFMELPAVVRAKFENDPQLLMEFLDSERNRDEAVKLGLVKAPPPAAPPPEPKAPAEKNS